MDLRIRLATLCLMAALFLAACSPMAVPTLFAASPSEAPAATPIAVNTPEATPTQVPPSPSPSPTLTETPLPTQTPLPTNIPAGVWVGAPTYPGDSKPGMYFTLEFDPATWELQQDPSGLVQLVDLQISGCTIVQAAGRGLPPGLIVNHETRTLGTLDFEVNRVFDSTGKLQFVTYQGGDPNIYTSFEVRFQNQPDACLQAAEALLATLSSVPEPAATPTPGP